MTCFDDLPPTNPISALLVGVLGENFYPPFDPNFSPPKRDKLIDEKLLKMMLPGGGKLMPIGDQKHVHISEYLTPLTGMLGTMFSFFGPLYIILDVIRALIDIICALFNPIPLILSVVDLFLNVVPPLIALFPPLSSVLLAINVIKLIVAIVGAIAASLIPLISDIVENSLTVATRISEGNMGVIDMVEAKLCELFQEFSNVLAGFGPLKFILEMIDIFMNLGAKFFCSAALPGQPGSPCCTSENCPPVIINPPIGRIKVLNTIKRYTLQDLLNSVFDVINIPLAAISDVLNVLLGNLFEFIEDMINNVTDGVENLVQPIEDAINAIVGLVGGPEIDLPDLEIPQINLEAPNLDLQLTAPQGFDDVVFVEPLMTLQYITATAKANASGLVSAVGVGHAFSRDELATVQNFIIDPDKVPSPEQKMPSQFGGQPQAAQEEKAVTLQVLLRNPASGTEVVTDAVFQFPTIQTIAGNLGLSQSQLVGLLNTVGLGFLPLNYLGVIQVRDDTFAAGTELEYEILPNYIELLKQNLIGLGCYPDVQLAAQAVTSLANADVGASFDNTVTSGFDPLIRKIGGRSIPPPPVEDLQDLLDTLQIDPTTPVDPLPIINDYLDDLADVYDSILCVGASSVQSLFEISKNNVLANGRDKAILAVRIKDAGGNDLLVGGKIPGSTFRVQFDTTSGTVGPVDFDETTGTFTASFTSDTVGEAEITASFIVREKICTKLSTFVDFPDAGQGNVRPKVINVNFVPEKTAYPRTRKQNQYVQSRGGRTRR